MSYFGQLATDFKRIDANSILIEILSDPKIQQFILDLPKNRIQKTGIAGDGTELYTDRHEIGEVYNAFTIDLKESGSGISSITSHVTLTQSGDFWKSQIIKIGNKAFFTKANFIKEDGHMQKNFSSLYSKKDFEESVLKLTNEDLNLLTEKYIYPIFINKLNKIIT